LLFYYINSIFCWCLLSVDPDPPDVAAISDLVKEKSEELDRETWKYTIAWDV